MATTAPPSHLDRLDSYSLLGVLDFLSIQELFKMAKLHPHYRDLIAQHYLIGQRHYDKRPIRIAVNEWCTMSSNLDYFADGCDETLLVLRLFGHIFGNIKVWLDAFGNARSLQVLAAVNAHCTRATIGVAIERVDADTLDDYHFTLDRANAVEVSVRRWASKIRLAEYFPAMQKLDIFTLGEMPVIAHHFPQLRRVNLRTLGYDLAADSQLLEFIRLNPQIRLLHTPAFGNNHSYIEYVQEWLPELETLSIHDIDDNPNNRTDVVRFNSVKHYHFASHRLVSQDADIRDKVPNVAFAQLESIAYFSGCPSPSSIDQLIEVLARHQTVKRVNLLSASAEWSRAQMVRLTESVPRMRELLLSWSNAHTTDAFMAFLAEPNGLERITARVYSGITADEFSATVPGAWEVDNFRVSQFYGTAELVRRNV